jgi:hypothetical protein
MHIFSSLAYFSLIRLYQSMTVNEFWAMRAKKILILLLFLNVNDYLLCFISLIRKMSKMMTVASSF